MRRIVEIFGFILVTTLIAMVFHAWLASHDEQLRMNATVATQKQLIDAANVRERDRAATLNQTLAEIEKLKHDAQTPEQILRELPKYLSLPQPITLIPNPNGDHAHPATASTENRKGTSPDASPRKAASSSRHPLSATLETSASVRFSDRAKFSTLPDMGDGPAGPAPRNASGATGLSTKGEVPDGTDRSPGPGSRNAQSDITDDLADALDPNSKHTGSGFESDLPNTANELTPAKHTAEIPTTDLKPLYDYVQDCRSCQAQLAAAKLNQADDAAKLAATSRERDAAITAAKGGTFWRRLRRNAQWFALGAAAGAAAASASCITAHRR
jgi:hypothetical protein